MPAPGSTGSAPAARCLTGIAVTHDVGLHARPSVTFTRLAKSFPCRIEVEVNASGVWFNGKSIARLMAARIRHGTIIAIRAEGVEADQAVVALKALVERDFDEEGDDGHSS